MFDAGSWERQPPAGICSAQMLPGVGRRLVLCAVDGGLLGETPKAGLGTGGSPASPSDLVLSLHAPSNETWLASRSLPNLAESPSSRFAPPHLARGPCFPFLPSLLAPSPAIQHQGSSLLSRTSFLTQALKNPPVKEVGREQTGAVQQIPGCCKSCWAGK